MFPSSFSPRLNRTQLFLRPLFSRSSVFSSRCSIFFLAYAIVSMASVNKFSMDRIRPSASSRRPTFMVLWYLVVDVRQSVFQDCHLAPYRTELRVNGNRASCSWLMALAFSEARFFLEVFSVANARVQVKMSPVVTTSAEVVASPCSGGARRSTSLVF